ncbi:energy transducer TonB [Pseudomonas sp. TNT2022 ID642]|uniref:energy transducer TonB n=1 Tax=Pseudomonas sp. TNT2022 ID642 TaxID=2942632 RepID=UPI002362E611|nr:energy transducer TonB [Pseudomonas sp. TNT2022 ID642]MDD1004014.1 energy transducer TonB [Pseudomonas sp. TNT2022 ID642]
MRWIVALLLLLVGGVVQAAGALLIPEDNPRPIYPLALSRAGITGEVKARFIVRADGSVSEISILKSDHPDLAEAVRVALVQWRFKPWAVEEDKPEKQEVVAPIVFRLDLDQPIHVNRQLKVLRCRTVNENLANIAEYSWIDSAAFAQTRAYLSNVFHKTQLPDEQRLAMIARMNRQVEKIVKACRESPTRKFISLLPTEIRELL